MRFIEKLHVLSELQLWSTKSIINMYNLLFVDNDIINVL